MRRKILEIIGTLVPLFAFSSAGAQEIQVLPPLIDPPGQHLIGKFVWSDLVTSEFDVARSFYQELFDLDWRDLSNGSDRYGLLEHDGYPVAGIAYRQETEASVASGHWLHFISVADVDAAISAVESAGGTTLLSPRDVARRGRLAAVTGPGGEALGLIRSSSGDPADYRAERGDWIWWELLTDEVDASAELMAELCRCDVAAQADRQDRYLISSQNYARAAIGPLAESETSAIWLGFVRVRDMVAMVSAAQRLGAQVLIEPGSTDGENDLAVIQDPAGGVIGLLAWTFSPSEASQ